MATRCVCEKSSCPRHFRGTLSGNTKDFVANTWFIISFSMSAMPLRLLPLLSAFVKQWDRTCRNENDSSYFSPVRPTINDCTLSAEAIASWARYGLCCFHKMRTKAFWWKLINTYIQVDANIDLRDILHQITIIHTHDAGFPQASSHTYPIYFGMRRSFLKIRLNRSVAYSRKRHKILKK